MAGMQIPDLSARVPAR